MSEEEIKILSKIAQVVHDSELRLLFEKQSCKIKKLFIKVFKAKVLELDRKTVMMEKDYLEMRVRKKEMEKSIESALVNITTTSRYIICLQDKLSHVKNRNEKSASKTQQDLDRFQLEYDDVVNKYESGPLPMKRKNLKLVAHKYSNEIAKLESELEYQKKNYEHHRNIEDNKMRQQVIRLAKHFDIKLKVESLKKNISILEANYTSILNNKENSQLNAEMEDNIKAKEMKHVYVNLQMKLNFITELEIPQERQSPTPEEDDVILRDDGVVQISDESDNENYSSVLDKTTSDVPHNDDIKKTMIDLTTSSFWKKTSEKNTTITRFPSMENNNFQKNNSIPPKQTKKKSAQPENISNGNSKKVEIIEDVNLNPKETAKILDKLPKKDSVKTVDEEVDQSNYVMDTTNKAQFENATEKTSVVACEDARFANNEENEEKYIEGTVDDVEMDESAQHKTQKDQSVSEFFKNDYGLTEDESKFLAPAAKMTKTESPQQVVDYGEFQNKNYISEIEMDLQAFNTQSTIFGETINDPDFVNTADSDGKSLAHVFIASPETEVKSKQNNRNKEEPKDGEPSTSSNFFSLFGDLNKKPSTSGFSFDFNKPTDKTDKPKLPSFFSPFLGQNPQHTPSQSNVEKKQLFFN